MLRISGARRRVNSASASTSAVDVDSQEPESQLG